MIRSICAAVLVLGCGLAVADTLAERWSKRIESADAIYQAAIQKAEDSKFAAVKKATLDRIRVLKSAISDATKAGDFTAAMELQSRLEAAEAGGAVRPKPKNTVKFGGHEYALINDQITWHVAKRICEEMGGHLAIANTPAEAIFLQQLCGQTSTWLGASDEIEEGKWVWIDDSPVKLQMDVNNQEGFDHWMVLYLGQFHDGTAGRRYSYACEWDH